MIITISIIKKAITSSFNTNQQPIYHICMKFLRDIECFFYNKTFCLTLFNSPITSTFFINGLQAAR